jgi:hypothetical protein
MVYALKVERVAKGKGLVEAWRALRGFRKTLEDDHD